MQRLLMAAVGLGVVLGVGFYYLQGPAPRSRLSAKQVLTDARGANTQGRAVDRREPAVGP